MKLNICLIKVFHFRFELMVHLYCINYLIFIKIHSSLFFFRGMACFELLGMDITERKLQDYYTDYQMLVL
jgi:hypothetical protein